MKNTIQYVALTILLSCGFVGNAQQADKFLESKIYQEYGTMLETLMKGNSITKENAVKYLEVVLDFDETATSNIQLADFDNKLNQLKLASKGKLSQQDFMTALNGNLLTLLPPASRQQMAATMEAQLRVSGMMSELESGKLGVNTLSLVGDLFADIRANRAERLRKEEIARKLSYVTPTLSMIKAADTAAYKKLKIIDEVDSAENWIAFNNPRILQDGDPETGSTNYAVLKNGYLTLSDPYKISDKQLLYFDILRCYKNPEQFDFSKDFAMTLYFKLNDKVNNIFNIEIGKGYHLSIMRNYNGPGRFYLMTPNKYTTTDKYGKMVGTNLEGVKRFSEDIDKQLNISRFGDAYTSRIYYSKKALAQPDEVLKVTIIKKGSVFTAKFNDLPGEMSTTVEYFPDKYSLGFSAKSESRTGSVSEIHKLELEHL